MAIRSYIKPAASFLALAALAFSLAIFSAKPSNDLSFAQGNKVLSSSTLQQGALNIHNVRDFRYNDDTSVKNTRYIDQTFLLSSLKQTWLGISHFHAGGLAHVFLSFEFTPSPDALPQYLVVSIEARLTEDQIYSPIKGMFRQYTKIVVLATEQDVIGLRTHIKKERVLLYPLRMNNIQQQALLLNFIRLANDLNAHAEFYNTLTDNCLTGLMAQSQYFKDNSHTFDYRILLPGYADDLAHQLGVINVEGSLGEIRQQATINPKNIDIQDPLFSQLIRTKIRTKQSALPIQQ